MKLVEIAKKEHILSQRSQNNDDKYHKINRISAILSMNRALLGEVSPSLRAAKIKWNEEIAHLYFYYDGKISEEDYEAAECVATEIIADFPDHKFEIDITRWDYPKPIPQEGGETVYRRKEQIPKPL
jgi:hypothetical protein